MSYKFKIDTSSYEYAKSDRVSWLDEFADNVDQATQKTAAIQTDRPTWLDAFADNIAGKSAVEVARERSQSSTYDDISNIFSQSVTVESKVKELQERIGLTDYLKRAEMISAINKKAAGDPFERLGPQMKDDIINYCKNRISGHRGQIAYPALQEDIIKTFKQYGVTPQDVETDDVAHCLDKMITDELLLNPKSEVGQQNLGKIDTSEDKDSTENTDFFKGMTPAIK